MPRTNKSKETFFCINIIIFIGLLMVCYRMNNSPIIEGITQMSCCGGIEPGVHYKETDTKPPEYVRRCFKSSGDAGRTVYQWSGFPCTQKESSDCCGDGGECTATTKGGYCKGTSSDYIYKRRDSEKSSYMKRSNDTLLDISDTIDMKDYFFDRSKQSNLRSLSPEMRMFMARRDENQKYMQEQHILKKSLKDADRNMAVDKIKERNRNCQITYTITLIHLIFLVAIAIFIKDTIIMKIQGFIDVINVQRVQFTGKPVQ